MAIVLITGGSGLIGRRLSRSLVQGGHAVRWLSRYAGEREGIRAFAWDLRSGTIDRDALEGVDHVVHLAGAGIADRRWTAARIRELIDSRSTSARLLLTGFISTGQLPRTMVSAAGIGYYGAITSDGPLTEEAPPGKDTIARISLEWERSVDEWSSHCRVVKLRTPVVLAREGGALPKLALPVRLGLGAALGSGRQWMPWVHIDDLVDAYTAAIADERMRGAYHAVGGNATNAELMRTLARVLHRPFFLPNVPAPLLRLALGRMADVLLEGAPIDGSRLVAAGHGPRRTVLEDALYDLLRPS
ncbi:MAG: TIGR01777 family oxidoreductase [Flavobacteriales bacterium]|nr:MAG: TIGR01777 family oxidoreductase [Flavobacteriales bacterium]